MTNLQPHLPTLVATEAGTRADCWKSWTNDPNDTIAPIAPSAPIPPEGQVLAETANFELRQAIWGNEVTWSPELNAPFLLPKLRHQHAGLGIGVGVGVGGVGYGACNWQTAASLHSFCV